MSNKSRTPSADASDSSRRAFVKKAVLGAGATAALGASGVAAQSQEGPENTTIPPEFAAAERASPPTVDFPMTGAQVFARACYEEGVKAT